MCPIGALRARGCGPPPTAALAVGCAPRAGEFTRRVRELPQGSGEGAGAGATALEVAAAEGWEEVAGAVRAVVAVRLASMDLAKWDARDVIHWLLCQVTRANRSPPRGHRPRGDVNIDLSRCRPRFKAGTGVLKGSSRLKQGVC